MQYTGLKDKNGKEIYEGDIITSIGSYYAMLKGWGHDVEHKKFKETFPEAVKEQMYIITWDNGKYHLYTMDGTQSAILNWSTHSMCESIAIIGNIYENPEILEKGVND